MPTLSSTQFLKAAHRTAHHFGFVPIDTLVPPPHTTQVSAQKASMAERRLDALQGVLTHGISTYFERALHDDKPVLFFSTQSGTHAPETAISLHVVGVKKSIAEALLIQATRSFIRTLGYHSHCVRVNSLGDHDSVMRYTRELTLYLKKRLEDMPPEAREMMKEDVMAAFLSLMEQNHELWSRSPSPLEYLTDASRRHFREIIEHLDMTKTPYEIDPRLLGHHRCYADTLFALELRDEHGALLIEPPLTIRGGRVDSFVTHILKLDVPATSAVVILNGKRVPTRVPRIHRAVSPSVFLVQLGFAPKIKCLMLLNTLQDYNISVHQALVSDSLGEQLRQAESYNVPFSLILGQKEFVENSIIVRDMRSRSQQNIPFDTLIPHLKRLLKRVS